MWCKGGPVIRARRAGLRGQVDDGRDPPIGRKGCGTRFFLGRIEVLTGQ